MKQKKIITTFLFFVFFTFLVFTTMYSTASAGEQAGKNTSKPDHDAMMEKYKEYSTPNENHKVLDAFVGDWNYMVKWWMTPDSEPEVSNGASTIKWIMGGRFIKHNAEGASMDKPFEGMGIMGYDNEKKQYQTVWIDNMGTGIVKGSGSYDSSTMTITEDGTFSCPMEGEKTYRSVTKILGKDSFTYEWYMNGPDGKEFKAMEIVYNRKK